MSRTISSFFLLLSTPLLLFNVEVPPFLVSWAIAFSYMYFCIGERPGSVPNPTPRGTWKHTVRFSSPVKKCHAAAAKTKLPKSELSQCCKRVAVNRCDESIKIVKINKTIQAGEHTRAADSEGRKFFFANEWKARSPLSLLLQRQGPNNYWAQTAALVVSILLLLLLLLLLPCAPSSSPRLSPFPKSSGG